MKALDVLGLSWNALRTQPRRSALTLLGVAVGVAAVVLLTALGEGALGYVSSQFQGLGSNLLVVVPGKVQTMGGMPGIGNTTSDLTLADAQALRRALPEASALAPMVAGTEAVAHGARSRDALVLGSTAEMAPLRSLEVAAGAFLPEGEWERGSAVVCLGAKLASELFPGESAPGSEVRIGEWRLRVIGVLRPRGMHFGANLDEAAFVPVTTAMRMFDRRSLFRLVIGLRSALDAPSVRTRIEALLAERHGRADVTIITPDAILGSLAGILDVLTLALAGIAAVSLGVAGLGIMNVMLVTVAERRAEIGLWKAIGATRAQVLALFLCEAALLSLAGGVLGLAAGELAARGIGLVLPNFPARAPAWAVAAALGTALAVGLVFGALPARRAVRLDPVRALSGR